MSNPDLVVKISANISALQADMAQASKSVEATTASWQEFTKGFDLEHTITHPLDSAKGAVSAFAGELGPAAVAALGMAAGVAAVGLALFELAEKAAAVGAHLNDMSEKTGLSVPALSKLSIAAQVAGGDLDQLTNAVFMLEKGMGEGSPKVEKGLERIGLSAAALKAAGPDQYLTLIAEHLKTIEDPATRAATVMELFGKQGKEIIPILMKLNDALELTADIKPWTDEQAKEAERFEMQMKSLVIHAEALSIAVGRDLIGPISSFVSGIVSAAQALNRWVDLSGGVLPMLQTMAEAWRTAAAAIDVFRGAVTEVPKITGDAARGVEAMHEKSKSFALHVPTLTEALLTQATVTKELASDYADITKAQKEAAQIAKEYEAILAHMDKETFQLAMEHEKQWRGEQLERAKVVTTAILAEFDAQIKLNAEWGLNAVGAIAANVTALDRMNLALDELHKHKVEGISQSAQEQVLIDAYTKSLYDDAVAQDTQTAAIARTTVETAKACEGFKQLAMASAAASLGATDAGSVDKFTHMTAGEQAAVSAGQFVDLSGVEKRWQGMSASAKAKIEGRAVGGPVASGSPYLVGERGPELFVPSASGSIVPNGGASGGTTVIQLVVDGRVLASIVNDQNTKSMKQSRQFPAA